MHTECGWMDHVPPVQVLCTDEGDYGSLSKSKTTGMKYKNGKGEEEGRNNVERFPL